MAVTHVLEQQSHAADDSLNAATAYATKRAIPIRMRIPIQLFIDGQYKSWKGQIWKIDADSVGEVIEIQAAMELFFDAISAGGAERVKQAQQEVLTRIRGQHEQEQTHGTEGSADPIPG